MEFIPKNREWVKNAAIVFLAVLLVLTFFSNTIMNRTLPEVATAAVTDGSIVAKVRGSGTVKANGNHDVKATQTREIRSVMVKVGQEVKTGDPLFVLGAGDSVELEAAKENLRDLQYAYQKAAVNMPNYSDYPAQKKTWDQAIRKRDSAKEAMDAAQATYNKMAESLGISPKEDKDKLDAAATEMKTAYDNLLGVQASYDERYLALSKIVDLWQNEVNAKLQGYQPAPTPVPTVPVGGTDTGSGTGTDDEEDNENQNNENQNNENQNNGQKTQGEPDGGTGDNTNDEVPDESGLPEQQGVAASTLSASGANRGFVKLLSVEPTGGYVFLSSTAGLPPIDITQKDKDPGVAKEIENLSLEDTKRYLATAQSDLSAFVSANSSTLKDAQAVYETAKAKYEALQKYNDSKYPELLPYKEALDNAASAYDAAVIACISAEETYNELVNSNYKSLTSASIDLQQMAEKIKLAQEKVKELSGDAGDQIVANVNGIVTSIGCSAGDTVTKDTVVCTIEVPDMGHTLSFSVTNDQAQRLRVGDTATVSNYYWGKEIVATLTTIRTDPKNPQTNKELTFDLSGDVSSGSELTISVGQKSANYDVIIPNSSIRSDNNGKFVLAVQAKSSPLGNRYIAKRVSVEVLASDDNNSAVVADLGYGDYVITTSSSPVKSGDQVRMAESNG